LDLYRSIDVNINLVGFIRSVEELVYEIIIWIVLYPKTIFKVLFNPSGMRKYITEEFIKEPEKRFKEYLSPFIFWALSWCIPLLIFVLTYSGNRDELSASTLRLFSNIEILILNLLGPVVFTTGIFMVSKENLTKESFRRPFYITLAFFSPGLLIFWSTLIFAGVNGNLDRTMPNWVFYLIFGSLIYPCLITGVIFWTYELEVKTWAVYLWLIAIEIIFLYAFFYLVTNIGQLAAIQTAP